MSGQPEKPERIPKCMTWRYRCCGVSNTRVREMGPYELRRARTQTGVRLGTFLAALSTLALIACLRHESPVLVGCVSILLMFFAAVQLLTGVAYLRCAIARKVVCFTFEEDDFAKDEMRFSRLRMLRGFNGSQALANVDVWMPSKIAFMPSVRPEFKWFKLFMPVQLRVTRYAATNPSFLAEGKLTREDRLELATKFGKLLLPQLTMVLAYFWFASVIRRFANTHAVYAPSVWDFTGKIIICFGVLYGLKTIYRIIIFALDVIVGMLDSNPGASAYWLRYSKIPWFEHNLPATWRTDEHPTEIPASLPRSVTKRIPV